jgi:hypothetical protein
MEVGEEKRGGIDLTRLVNSAVQEGVGIIASNQPKFTPELLAQYLDPKKLNQYALSIARKAEEYQQQGKDPQDAINHAYRTLAGKVASGRLFNDRGKEIVLNEGLQKRAKRMWFGRGAAKEVLEGEKYLDDAMKSMRDVYTLMKSGDYAKKMPDLANALSKLDDLGFLDATSNILYKNGQLNEGKYMALKSAIRDKTEKRVGDVQKYIDHYFSQSLAAAVLAIVGIGVLFTSNGITGNVIGTAKETNIVALIFGGISLIFGIYLLSKLK